MNYHIIILFTVIVSISIYIIYKIYINILLKEGFITNKWSPDLIRKFNIYQTTMNNNANQFNLEVLQQQATPAEVEQLIKTGYWPWSDTLKQQYVDHVWSSPIIKIDPQYALDYAMRIYNQKAVTELLAWNSKEGDFLLYGGINQTGDVIKCSNTMIMTKNDKPLNPEDIPKEMPGFTFINNSCDPCQVFNRDFSCPFKLNIDGDDSISSPWKKLWKI